MRTIERSKSFKRDYKRIKKTPQYGNQIDALLRNILTLLVQDIPLPVHNRDHNLSGNWVGYRECHIKPDLLLIYQKSEKESPVLRLARLGSHSELFS